jgi:glutamate-1-semialdehyde 2,1-aminomutase
VATIDRARLESLLERQEKLFVAEHPRSAALYKRAENSLIGGVPMSWMKKWAGAFPVFVAHAKGARFTCVDGHEYVDLCLGDTGAMTGHSPEVVVETVAKRARDGITLMLPTEDALFLGEDLKKRFGLPYWQFTLTATDANRFSIRIAREITQRSKILVFHYCYHGTVDESFAGLHDGLVVARRGNIGPPVNPAETTRVVEFNDLNALEAALKHHDVACILAEPAMTNVGIILPDDGYWKAARELARRYGALLIADETHTICAALVDARRNGSSSRTCWCSGKRSEAEFPAPRMDAQKKWRSALRREFIWRIAMSVGLAERWREMHCRWRRCVRRWSMC